MDENQFKRLMEVMVKTIDDKIDVKVNGKIDKLTEKVDMHREELQPILDAYKSANTVGNGAVWLSKVMLAIGAIIGTIVMLIKIVK